MVTGDDVRAWVRRHGVLLSRASMLVCVATLIAICWQRSLEHPQELRFGDDVEYLLGAQSFARHHSPDYQPGDEQAALAPLPKRWRNSAKLKYRPPAPSGYHPAKNGKLYSWHFFTYAAAVAPFESQGRLAFHIANLTYFSLAVLAMLQLWAAPRLWLTLLPFAFFTPVLWFIPIVHTEPFVFSLGLAAASCWLCERRLFAIFFSAVAATQFQPLALVTAYFGADSAWAHCRGVPLRDALRTRWHKLAATAVLTALAFIPNVFYYVNYGTPSVVTREGYAASSLMSVSKLASMFIDLNTGLAVYLPGVFLLWAWSVWAAARAAVRERSLAPLVLSITLIAALYASTSARIWNYHTQGISRYMLYCVPVALLAIGMQLKAIARLSAPLIALVVVAFGLQVLVHREFGWFGYEGNNNLDHNPIARHVLTRWPALYAPPPEIFCSRTHHKRCWIDLDTGWVTGEYLPAVFLDAEQKPTKALIAPCEPDGTLKAAQFTQAQSERIRAAARDCKPGSARAPTFINFR